MKNQPLYSLIFMKGRGEASKYKSSLERQKDDHFIRLDYLVHSSHFTNPSRFTYPTHPSQTHTITLKAALPTSNTTVVSTQSIKIQNKVSVLQEDTFKFWCFP